MALALTNWIFYLTALIFLLIMYVFFGVFSLRRYLNEKESDRETAYLQLFYGLAFIFNGIGRFVLAIFDIITEFDAANYNPITLTYWRIGSGLQILGVGMYFYLMEKRVMRGRDKYILLIIYFLLPAIGILFIPDIITVTFLIIFGMLFAVYIPIAYLYIAKISDGIIRKRALLIFLGLLVMILGSLLPSEIVIVPLTQNSSLERIHVHIIAFAVIIIGGIILFYGVK
ncbi:MAG: hypothetical protein ACTSR8_00860 [Promethearchaeota archaeon]